MNQLERLLAIEDIKRCKARYARGADSQDWELFASAFTADAVWDLRGFAIARSLRSGEWNSIGSKFDLPFLEDFSNMITWPKIGRDAIKNGSRDIMVSVNASFHRLFNPEIDITTDAEATALWPFEETIQFSGDGPVNYMNGLGYYHETYAREDGRWLIKTCRLLRTIFNIG
jgi:hypothetical protein